MKVFRISALKYADGLQASGIAARWNRKGQKVIYTAESRSLACLENVVHSSKMGLMGLFKILIIEIPDSLKMEISEEKALPASWKKTDNYRDCQKIGSLWFSSGKTAILKVPSALVPQESNYILNTLHPDFQSIRLVEAEEFYFDSRIISL
jgi:RES domain-containing protein